MYTMAVVSVQFGQCGNQIGHEFYSMLSEDERVKVGSDYAECDRWFRNSAFHNIRTARAVLVDTEQKVIHKVSENGVKNRCHWRYSTENVVASDGGAGNNWALGYVERGPKMKDRVMECVRKEIEEADRLTSLLIMASSAGGTGSGVGSCIAENLKDDYPNKHIINILVLPYKNGDVITQNYNTLLTCAKLYDVCDMHVLFQNDHLYKMVSNLIKTKDINFNDLNALISLKMMAVFQPVERGACSTLPDIVSQLTPHPGMKLVTFKSAPHTSKETAQYESSFLWENLIQHLLQSFRVSSVGGHIMSDYECKAPSRHYSSRSSEMKFSPCISNVLFTRGPMPELSRTERAMLCDPLMYKKWVPASMRYVHCHSNKRVMGTEKFATLASNNMLMFVPIDEVLDKAWNMYTYKAYLHQYKKYNVTEDDFIVAFAKLESIVKMYKDIG
ncbi:tubulin delta chain-like [Schistocerca piceifrons]|uniref:tubulin delta chain-like n=1 Tax=Schistocerca piceifrons TaxID=274613 RepID=UPI001F5FECB9|nr:tubulin delta chain-like [Schistocerca piceifrons]